AYQLRLPAGDIEEPERIGGAYGHLALRRERGAEDGVVLLPVALLVGDALDHLTRAVPNLHGFVGGDKAEAVELRQRARPLGPVGEGFWLVVIEVERMIERPFERPSVLPVRQSPCDPFAVVRPGDRIDAGSG